jgi:hypothetical protein
MTVNYPLSAHGGTPWARSSAPDRLGRPGV